MSSNGAYNFDVFDPPHHRANKAALDPLTKDIVRRYAKEMIAVNSVGHSMTETPLFKALSEEVLAQVLANMPHGCALQAQKIAVWVAFLTCWR
jgi:NAD(P)-dependent dehydrogenase (short-subunit alcohol dehydrogenase family)